MQHFTEFPTYSAKQSGHENAAAAVGLLSPANLNDC